MAGKPYGNLGHRRVLVIANSTAEAQQATAGDAGVTPLPVGFHRLTDRPTTFGRTTIAATPSGGMSADQKHGSKFTLPDKATLLGFSAYFDGLGGPVTGSQNVRLVLTKTTTICPPAAAPRATS